MTSIDLQLIEAALLAALREDVGSGDITSRAVIPPDSRARARYTTKQSLVVSGIPVIEQIVRLVDPSLEFKALVPEGASVGTGMAIAEMRGSARSILTAERTSLNLLQRMCGIATVTRRYVERIQGTRARIVDTRKTVPGLRILDKYAVTCGGGMNHRMGLFDGVLIKNNHLAFHASVEKAVQAARAHLGHLVKIEVEVRDLDELNTAINSGADVILLDNFTPETTSQAVKLEPVVFRLNLPAVSNSKQFAASRKPVSDYISIGALTHSVAAVDIHLRVTPE